MRLSIINLYELGQFLQIVLWISLPVAVIAMLITTYIHYRRKRLSEAQPDPEELVLAEGGIMSDGYGAAGNAEPGLMTGGTGTSGPGIFAGGNEAGAHGTEAELSEADGEPGVSVERDEPEDGDRSYKGMLWMKEKYEQYVEFSDARYYRLKDQLQFAERRYQALVGGRGAETTGGTSAVVEGGEDAGAGTEDSRSESWQAMVLERDQLRDLAADRDKEMTGLQVMLEEKDQTIKLLQGTIGGMHERQEAVMRAIAELEGTIQGLRGKADLPVEQFQ